VPTSVPGTGPLSSGTGDITRYSFLGYSTVDSYRRRSRDSDSALMANTTHTVSTGRLTHSSAQATQET